MRIFLISFFFISVLSMAISLDLIVGDTLHKRMVFFQRVKSFAFPFKKTIKTLSYSDPDKRIIKGIAVVDKDFSDATANITEGGVGYTHATIRFKSQRSHPLNFEVEIYV